MAYSYNATTMVDDTPPQDNKEETMKKFDLKAALNGEPVMLRNGEKAFIKYNLLDELENIEARDAACPLIGYRLYGNYVSTTSWELSGKSIHWATMKYDIVGMFEEPKLTQEQVLEKAYKENLLVLCDGNPDLPLKVIAKTKDGEFVMQPEDDTIQPWIANLTMEWFFVKDPDPKFDTITNTIALPKPFKPKDGEPFYYIYWGEIYCDYGYSERSSTYRSFSQNGQCFRTEEDAQKWLDFMKGMME